MALYTLIHLEEASQTELPSLSRAAKQKRPTQRKQKHHEIARAEMNTTTQQMRYIWLISVIYVFPEWTGKNKQHTIKKSDDTQS